VPSATVAITDEQMRQLAEKVADLLSERLAD